MNKSIGSALSAFALDRIIHEPARLKIMTYLLSQESADFNHLLQKLGFTKGNLSCHLTKLEKASYVKIVKTFFNKMPKTLILITPEGKAAYIRHKNELLQLLQLVEV